jgi:hypothetical protein
VTFDQDRIGCSSISSIQISTNEGNAIGSKSLLLEDTENKSFLFIDKHLGVIKSHRSILHSIEYIIDIMASSGGEKLTGPGMSELIFLESFVVRDDTFDILAGVLDGRG